MNRIKLAHIINFRKEGEKEGCRGGFREVGIPVISNRYNGLMPQQTLIPTHRSGGVTASLLLQLVV